MPRGRKKKLLDTKKTKVSKEVIDIFFNDDIKEETEETEIPETVEETGEENEQINVDELVEKDSEVPENSPITEGIVENVEHVIMTTLFNDDGDEIQTVQHIRSNPPPKESWADKGTRFKCGQQIIPKKLLKSSYPTYECSVVISAGISPNTYMVKHSRGRNESCIHGDDWMEADKKCKPYVSYWDSISPIIKCKK